MKIVICGSMAFVKEMVTTKRQLEDQGHVIILPELVRKFLKYKQWQLRAKKGGGKEGARLKRKHDLIRKHYEKIKEADAILVLNYDKKGIKNYIGGNSFLEMGFAHILRKPIYLINPLPSDSPFLEEMLAMEPIILNGDLSKIK